MATSFDFVVNVNTFTVETEIQNRSLKDRPAQNTEAPCCKINGVMPVSSVYTNGGIVN